MAALDRKERPAALATHIQGMVSTVTLQRVTRVFAAKVGVSWILVCAVDVGIDRRNSNAICRHFWRFVREALRV